MAYAVAAGTGRGVAFIHNDDGRVTVEADTHEASEELAQRLPGAAWEWSPSGRGKHFYMRATRPCWRL